MESFLFGRLKNVFIVFGALLASLFLFSLTASASAITTGSFSTMWDTGASTSITIPTTGAGYNYNIYIEEVADDTNNATLLNQTGDATINSLTTNTVYRIDITGTFPRFYLNNGADSSKLETIEQWGDIAWTSMANAFHGASNLTYNATDAPDLSGVTDMSVMFEGATAFNGDISAWDVSSVISMTNIFYDASSFNQDIGSWNTAAVENMYSMFYSASAFNQDLNSWNTSAVTDMAFMFEDATAFNGDIGDWDVSGVLLMNEMFYGAIAFNQNLSAWDVSSVTDIEYMFQNATAFNGNISIWNVSSVTNMADLFHDASSFNQDLSSWNVSSVTSMSGMFQNASAFNQDLSSWDVSSVVYMSSIFNGASSLSNQNYSLLLNGWAALPTLQNGVSLGAIPASYFSNAATARDTLLNTYSWTFTDGGLDTTTYSVNYTAGLNGSITGTASQTIQVSEDTSAVTATPDEGYMFSSWSDGSTSNPRTDTYVVSDLSVSATFTVLTNGSHNDAPVANDDTAITNFETAVLIDVLANDTDDGTLASNKTAIVTDAVNGTTSVDLTTGEITYTPDAGFTGEDTFTYLVWDNDNTNSNTATVTVTVAAAVGDIGGGEPAVNPEEEVIVTGEDPCALADIAGHRYEDAIIALCEAGVIEGYRDEVGELTGVVGVDDMLNRAESQTIITRSVFGEPAAGNYKSCFPDVNEEWFAVYVCYAKGSLGLTGYQAGENAGYMLPADAVSFEELTKMLITSNEIELATAVDGDEWYQVYLDTAEELGALEGLSLSVGQDLTRGQSFQLMYNVLVAIGTL